MSKSENIKVNKFLTDIQSHFPERYEIFVQVKNLFTKNGPNLIEDIKYGGIVFFDGQKLIGGIFQYKKHISIEFSYGAGLSDPFTVLEGKGKLRRHIKIYNLNDVNLKEVTHYISEAVVYKPK